MIATLILTGEWTATGARWASSGNYRLLIIGTLESFQCRDGCGHWYTIRYAVGAEARVRRTLATVLAA